MNLQQVGIFLPQGLNHSDSFVFLLDTPLIRLFQTKPYLIRVSPSAMCISVFRRGDRVLLLDIGTLLDSNRIFLGFFRNLRKQISNIDMEVAAVVASGRAFAISSRGAGFCQRTQSWSELLLATRPLGGRIEEFVCRLA
jgi:hypothetical protein